MNATKTIKAYENANTQTGKNGYKFIPFNDNAVQAILHLSTKGNTKTGPVAAFNLPIEQTCNHACECYSTGACYACGGFYQYKSNMFLYAENLKYFLTVDSDTFVSEMVKEILKSGLRIFRWFTCGDIVNYRFFECMIKVASRLPFVTFWSYTKKYAIVNKYIDQNGINSIPGNLTIIFSHWLNNNGTYFPMDNKYNMPTSEFIPFGKEELLKEVNHVCPCSDPDIFVNCVNCTNPCYKLKPGMSMALCEHSTPETRQRDKMLKELKQKALENGNVKLAELLEKAANLAA